MTKFDELKERFPNLIPVQELRSNISIMELAVQYGYAPQNQKGRGRPVLEHPDYKDTIIIKNPQDAAQQVYQRAGDFTDSGTIIDFIRNRLSTVFSKFNRPGEHEFKNITNVLYDYLRIDPTHVNQNRKATTSFSESALKGQFAKDQFDIRALDPDNYLTKRNIAPETINRPEFERKVVAQVAYFNPQSGQTESFITAKEHPERKYLTFTNVAFPYYNGQTSEITGLELRNDNIKIHAPGSDRFSSVFVSNAPAKVEQFFIMESAIDALSHQQLRNIRGDNAFNSVYFSTGGQLTPQQVNTITRYMGSFEKSPDWKFNLVFDNDTKGYRFDLQFIQQLSSTKFPMSPTVGGLNRTCYLLPESETYKPTKETLLRRISAYNANVSAQFDRTDQDVLGKKEMSNQQIVIGKTGQQVSINIPETCAALTFICKELLDLTELNQRIQITKSVGKDFNEDLDRQVNRTEKYRYSLSDESGQIHYNGSVATLMARTLNHIKNTAETEGQTKTLVISERQPFGFQKPQVEVRIEAGQVVKATQIAEFQQQLHREKNQRQQENQNQTIGQAKKILNPENKPSLGQDPDEQSRNPQSKPKMR